MNRQVLAALLLLVAAVSSLSQGMAVVICRCSGETFLGSAPQGCCEGCPSETTSESLASAERGICAADCFMVIAKERHVYPPVSGRQETPAPDVADGEAPGEFGTGMDGNRAWLSGSRTSLRLPAPPGRPRTLLYASLQI